MIGFRAHTSEVSRAGDICSPMPMAPTLETELGITTQPRITSYLEDHRDGR